jgi:hypothetical protein
MRELYHFGGGTVKTDLTKKFKGYYRASRIPEIASFEGGRYLTIEGSGAPAGEEFSQKVEALYPVAYGVKKICKARRNDFAVPKLEALWWVDGNRDARGISRNEWKWKLLIRVPEFVTQGDVTSAKEERMKRKKLALAAEIHLERLENGRCVQLLHVGPYSDEPRSIDLMHKFMETKGLKADGLHHEIYLSDPRKTAPQKIKTVLRQPVQ